MSSAAPRLDGVPFKKREKDERMRMIRRFSMVYAVDVRGHFLVNRRAVA